MSTTKPPFEPRILRRRILDMAYAGSTVHIPSAFCLVELLSVLYRSHLRLGARPGDPGRDYLVLSKGHGVMAQYACLAELGWIREDQLQNYFGDGTYLKGLSDAHVPGLEVTSGSLGHGLSVGVGLAFAAKRQGTGQRTYAIVGDGEMNEGPMWEAMLFAAHALLKDLVVIVDQNGFQAMGTTDEVMRLGKLATKFAAFDFMTLEVDGHDVAAIDVALTELENATDERPKALIARTVKGKGVSFIENRNEWHYTRLNAETYAAAIREVDAS